jgi:hypothetical protein
VYVYSEIYIYTNTTPYFPNWIYSCFVDVEMSLPFWKRSYSPRYHFLVRISHSYKTAWARFKFRSTISETKLVIALQTHENPQGSFAAQSFYEFKKYVCITAFTLWTIYSKRTNKTCRRIKISFYVCDNIFVFFYSLNTFLCENNWVYLTICTIRNSKSFDSKIYREFFSSPYTILPAGCVYDTRDSRYLRRIRPQQLPSEVAYYDV